MKRSFSLTSISARWLVVASTALVAGTYGLVRLAYGLYLPEMQADLQFDSAVAGLISAGASVAYCIGAACGFAAASHHARPLIVAVGVSGGVGAAGVALSPNVSLFACFAILSSAAAGMASPALVRILTPTQSDATQSDATQSVVNAGTGPGLVIAGILALTLLPDWRSAWLVAALFTVLAAVGVLTFGRTALPDEPVHPTAVPPTAWWVAHFRVIVAALLMGAGSAAVWNYGRVLIIDTGASTQESVLAWIALGLGGSMVIPTAHVLGNLGPRIAWALTTGVTAGATAALVFAGQRNLLMTLAVCAVFGWAFVAATGALIAWTMEIDADRAPTGTAMLFVILILGQAMGAASVGAVVAGIGYSAAFLASATVCAAAVPLGLVGGRRPVDLK